MEMRKKGEERWRWREGEGERDGGGEEGGGEHLLCGSDSCSKLVH